LDGVFGGSNFEIQVPTTTVDAIIDLRADGVWPNFLSIDAEGRDLEIIESIDWTRSTLPLVVCLEALSQLGDISQALNAKMSSVGYFLHSWCGGNVIFVQEQFRKQVY
jgi:hypothetical protein